jgi:hypothetical protein
MMNNYYFPTVQSANGDLKVRRSVTKLCCMPSKGSRKNKFTFSTVETPAWQGAKAQEYRDISSFRNAARHKCIGALKCKFIFTRALSVRSAMGVWFAQHNFEVSPKTADHGCPEPGENSAY